MMTDQLKDSALPRALSDVVSDLADLFQKELRLARTELSEKLSNKLRSGIWMSAAAAFAFGAFLLILQALVFAIASSGIALHWACLIVAAALIALGGIAFTGGRADAAEELTPTRTIHQVKQDFATAKEQLS
jgi:uncharacterized membrane protein YqjE